MPWAHLLRTPRIHHIHCSHIARPLSPSLSWRGSPDSGAVGEPSRVPRRRAFFRSSFLSIAVHTLLRSSAVLFCSLAHTMAVPETSSIAWFVTVMRLHNHGVIPSVTPSEYLPSRPQLADFMGPKYNSGYKFDSHGLPEYEEYVRELFVRVLQMKWPVNNVLPFHFSRGLLSEAMGTEVNWAELAFKLTHPHQSRTKIPRVLQEFTELQVPLHPLVKVAPLDIATEKEAPMPTDRYFNRQRFPTPYKYNNIAAPIVNSAVVGNIPAASKELSAAAAPPRYKYGTRSDVRMNLEVGEPSARKSEKIGADRPVFADIGLVNILPALRALRPGIMPLVNAEHVRLQETRQLAYAKMSKCMIRYREEKEKERQIGTEIEERMATHTRAVQQYEHARRVLVTTLTDIGDIGVADGKVPLTNYIRNGEALVNSWYENVRISRKRLEEWEFKSESQGVVVGRFKGELNQAEGEYRKICESLDVQVAHLRAVTDLLEDGKA